MGKTALNLDGVKAACLAAVARRIAREIVGLFQAPATKIAQLSNAPAAKVARVVQAYAAKNARRDADSKLNWFEPIGTK